MNDSQKEECVDHTAPVTDAPHKSTVSTVAHQSDNEAINESWYERYNAWRREDIRLPRHYKLSTEENAAKYSLWSVNFMIIASAVNTKMVRDCVYYCTQCVHAYSYFYH